IVRQTTGLRRAWMLTPGSYKPPAAITGRGTAVGTDSAPVRIKSSPKACATELPIQLVSAASALAPGGAHRIKRPLEFSIEKGVFSSSAGRLVTPPRVQ